MKYKEAVEKLLKTCNVPAAQLWVAKDELLKVAKKLDGISKRHKRRLVVKS